MKLIIINAIIYGLSTIQNIHSYKITVVVKFYDHHTHKYALINLNNNNLFLLLLLSVRHTLLKYV